MKTAEDGQETALRLHEGEDWTVLADTDADGYHRTFRHNSGGREVACATLRRIGWLDQRGRAWKHIPPGAVAEEMQCGSFTPLLIDARDG
jgi:hypothetical protein